MKAIRSYIKQGLEQGYSLSHLKLELVKAGHSTKDIEKTLQEKETKKEVKHHSRFDKAILGGLFLIIILIMFGLSAASDQSLFNVFLACLPTIVSITLAIVIVESYKENHSFVWAVPLVFIALFYVMAPQYLIFVNLDVPQITVMNLVISYLFIIVINFIAPPHLHKMYSPPEPQIIVREIPKEIIKEVIKEVPVVVKKEETLQALEDKCKAINQVIGRVYRQSFGGSKELRNKIKIPRDWYNAFSKQEIDFALIKKLLERLSLFNKTEKEVFGNLCKDFKRLKRDKNANDRIMEVLKSNDDDPIETYVSSAIAVCEQALKEK